RRTGKTFLLEKLIKDSLFKKEKIAFLKGDQKIIKDVFSSTNPQMMIDFIGKDTKMLVIDEAQKIENIGENLKILIDEFPYLKIIASGSASFELTSQLGEPLTGRKKTLLLYPISVSEIVNTKNQAYYQSIFEQHLIYGGYPEIFLKSSIKEKKEYLKNLVDDYLFRDILMLEQIKNSKKLRDLLSLLAFQIGKEVSLNELGNNLDLHKDTVARYLDLMKKSFIIFNIRGFSRNLRKEIYKTSRWYFYDNGIRNALINNFNPINLRNDVGELWENYIITERLKKQQYQEIFSNNYFWRTYDQKEIDWIEEREGKIFGYEIKWQLKNKKPPRIFLETYPNSTFQIINKTNFFSFIA
ncbi:MAG: ATP-binding protein, partial [Patescibacteria group bacterium]|nr:ATP-binding protein [Patescibacteria group bacterium]